MYILVKFWKIGKEYLQAYHAWLNTWVNIQQYT